MNFFRSAIADLAEARDLILTALFIFIGGVFLGILAPEYGRPLLASLQALAQELSEKGTGGLVLAIFVRNASTAVLAILAGTLLGVVPAFSALVNGLIFGVMVTMVPGEIWKVLPHGVFELPAMFASWGLGLWVGQWPFGPDRLLRLRHRLIAGLRALTAFILPLLILAAAIEGVLAVYLYGRF